MLLPFLKRLLPGPGPRVAAREVAGADGVASSARQSAFTESLLREFFVLVHQGVQDNYDYVRYSHDGVDRSKSMDAAGHASYLDFFFRHAADFLAAMERLDDAESRALFRRLILYRMLGHLHVQIRDGAGWAAETALYDQAQSFDRGGSVLAVHGMLGPLHHHTEVPTPGGPATLDCWGANVVYTALKKQYFFSRGGVVVEPRAGEVVIDAGACFGDTAVFFAMTTGREGRVYGFDPLAAHQTVINLNIAQNGLEDRVIPVPLAVSDTTSGPAPDGAPDPQQDLLLQPGFSLRGAGTALPMTSIDDFADAHALERVDFIKMDIEGSELAALEGARRVIERFRPRLAISLYHRPGDLFEIPLWLDRAFPWYDLHLDHYTIHQEETVLFAVPRSA